VTDRVKPGFRPGVYRSIQLRIAIEGNAEGIRLEDAVKLGIDADDGDGLVVVGERPARSEI